MEQDIKLNITNEIRSVLLKCLEECYTEANIDGYQGNNNKIYHVDRILDKYFISDVIISTDKLSEYQLEIRTRLREKFNDLLHIEIGRGDRLLVNGFLLKGFLIYDSRNRKDYDNDIKFFSDEIKIQYLDKK
jgi:hypothetical protein